MPISKNFTCQLFGSSLTAIHLSTRRYLASFQFCQKIVNPVLAHNVSMNGSLAMSNIQYQLLFQFINLLYLLLYIFICVFTLCKVLSKIDGISTINLLVKTWNSFPQMLTSIQDILANQLMILNSLCKASRIENWNPHHHILSLNLVFYMKLSFSITIVFFYVFLRLCFRF